MYPPAGGAAPRLELPAKNDTGGALSPGDVVQINLGTSRTGYKAKKPEATTGSANAWSRGFTVTGVVVGPTGASYLDGADIILQVLGVVKARVQLSGGSMTTSKLLLWVQDGDLALKLNSNLPSFSLPAITAASFTFSNSATSQTVIAASAYTANTWPSVSRVGAAVRALTLKFNDTIACLRTNVYEQVKKLIIDVSRVHTVSLSLADLTKTYAVYLGAGAGGTTYTYLSVWIKGI